MATPVKLGAVPTKEQLAFRHPEWAANHKLWKFTRDHYEGAVLRPELLAVYLRQKRQGEANDAFRERAEMADYTNHFGTIVDSLVGMLSAVEDDASRVWGLKDDDGNVSGLGDPKDPDSVAARLYRDADGMGTSWLSFWSEVATELSLTHVGWLMADARGEEDGAVLRYLAPGAVVNWRTEGEQVTEVLIAETTDARGSLWEKGGESSQYLHLTLWGWARYRPTRTGVELVGDPEPWGVKLEDVNGNPILPIRQLRVPVRRQVGYYLAKKQNAIYNRESHRDHLLSVANFPKLNVAGGEAVYNAVVEALKKGNNVLQGTGHEFIAPDTSSATLSSEVLEKKARELYMTGFREYGDAARERTATEVKQDVAAGAGSYLTLLARALDQAETWALHVLTQLETPEQADALFAASVSRSTEFAPADPEVTLDRLLKRTFGPDVPVPLGRTAQENAALMAADYMGLGADPEQVRAAVAANALVQALTATGLPFPATVRVQAMGKVLAAQGLVDPEAVVKLEDGSSMKLMDAILKEAEALAAAEDVAKRREAETFGVGGPPPFPPRPPAKAAAPGEEPDDDEEVAA